MSNVFVNDNDVIKDKIVVEVEKRVADWIEQNHRQNAKAGAVELTAGVPILAKASKVTNGDLNFEVIRIIFEVSNPYLSHITTKKSVVDLLSSVWQIIFETDDSSLIDRLLINSPNENENGYRIEID